MSGRDGGRGRRDAAPASARRRQLLAGSTALLLGSHALPGYAADIAAQKQPPQPGDELAFPSYENDGRLLGVADLATGAEPLLAYPRDPATGLTRERSRLNQILVVRLAADTFDAATRDAAAGDVVAYSAVCTHTACGITGWKSEVGHFVCPCHQSEFAAARHGTRVTGPAPRALPLLPIRLAKGHFVVAGGFSSRVGANQS